MMFPRRKKKAELLIQDSMLFELFEASKQLDGRNDQIERALEGVKTPLLRYDPQNDYQKNPTENNTETRQ